MPEVDVSQHREIMIPDHIEDDLAQRIGAAIRRHNVGRCANDHARDPVEYPRMPQHVQVGPDRCGRGGNLFPEEDRAIEMRRAEGKRRGLNAHDAIEQATD